MKNGRKEVKRDREKYKQRKEDRVKTLQQEADSEKKMKKRQWREEKRKVGERGKQKLSIKDKEQGGNELCISVTRGQEETNLHGEEMPD